MLNTDGMFLSYIHVNMPGGTQSRGMAPLALVLNLLARRKTMYLRQGERLGIYLQNLLIASFFCNTACNIRRRFDSISW